MRAFSIELADEGIEAFLLLQAIEAALLNVSLPKVREESTPT
jgi:hypothetical protein